MKKLSIILAILLCAGVAFAGSTVFPNGVQIGKSVDDVQPTLTMIGDADSDAGGDTCESVQLTLTPNADPTLATWGFTSTQGMGYTFDKHVGIGATPGAPAHFKVIDTAWDITSTSYGIYNTHTKTAGVTDATDDIFHLYNVFTYNHNGSTIGQLRGISNTLIFTDGTTGATEDVYGTYNSALLNGGIVGRSHYGQYNLVNLNTGTVTTNVYGLYNNVDIEAEMTSIGGDVYGIYSIVDDDDGTATTVYNLYLQNNTNTDYAIYSANDVPSYFGGGATIGAVGIDSTFLLGTSINESQPKFQIVGDADSDAADTSETVQLTLTPNATPTLATWDFTSTQSAGYNFDKNVTIASAYVYRAGGTDVPDADVVDTLTITNISQVQDITASAAEINTIDDCATTELFVGGGAGSAPVCTTATGTGAPVRAGSPTFTTLITMGSAGLNEAELEILDGATTTTTQLNYLNGVTGISGTGNLCLTTNCQMTTPDLGAATADSITIDASSTPAWVFRDLENPGSVKEIGIVSAQFLSGGYLTEDGGMYFSSMLAGSEVVWGAWDSDEETVTLGDSGTGEDLVLDFETATDNEVEVGTNSGVTRIDFGSILVKTGDIKTKSFAINEATADDDFLLWKTPVAITIAAVNGVLLTGTNVIGHVDECDSAGANCATIDSTADITFNGGNDADDGDLSNPSIDAGDWLHWHTTSVDAPGYLTITVSYTID